ncbi:MAG: hypothetical protein ACXWWI_10550 [Nitrospira sp.]
MITHDFDTFSPSVRPTEAKAELIVHTNAVLARDQLPQLASYHGLDIRESPDMRSFGKRLRIGAFERLGHRPQ